MPYVGVCTTNYNCGAVLERHIESVYHALRGLEFEYIVVDSFSTDQSWEILERSERERSNFRVMRRKCKRGEGRNIAYRQSRAPYILSVDTDTVYHGRLGDFLVAYFSRPDLASTAVKAGGLQGIYPRQVLDAVGGWGNLNCDDWDLTVRIWKKGLGIKVYPVSLGDNIKDRWEEADFDFMSDRYGRLERLARWANIEIEQLGRSSRWRVDMKEVCRDLFIDLGLEDQLRFGNWGTDWLAYSSVRSYLRHLRGKVLLYLGVERTLGRWAEERRKRDRGRP